MRGEDAESSASVSGKTIPIRKSVPPDSSSAATFQRMSDLPPSRNAVQGALAQVFLCRAGAASGRDLCPNFFEPTGVTGRGFIHEIYVRIENVLAPIPWRFEWFATAEGKLIAAGQ